MTSHILFVSIVALLLSNTSYARNFDNSQTIKGQISLVEVDHVGTALSLGGGFDVGLAPRVVLSTTIDYWSKTDKDPGYTVRFRDLTFAGMGKYMFQTNNHKLSPFVGIGLAIHMLKAEVEFDTIGLTSRNYEDSESELGIDLGAGLEYQIDRDLSFGGMIKYRDVSDEDLDQFAIMGVLSQSI